MFTVGTFESIATDSESRAINRLVMYTVPTTYLVNNKDGVPPDTVCRIGKLNPSSLFCFWKLSGFEVSIAE